MPYNDVPAIPYHTTVCRAPLYSPKPATAIAAIPPPIHSVTDKPTSTDDCIHGSQHARLFQCAPGTYSQSGQGRPPRLTAHIILVNNHARSRFWHTRKQQHWPERNTIPKDRRIGTARVTSTEQLHARKVWRRDGRRLLLNCHSSSWKRRGR
jgi:hypothetical protein